MKNSYLIHIIQKTLSLENVLPDRKDILKVLFSSPTFPSLAAVSQTLSYFGLHNNAFITDLNHLFKLKNVIIHSIKEEGHFYILTEIDDHSVKLYDGKEKRMSIEDFTAIWDGVVLQVEDKENINIKQSTNLLFFCGLGFLLYLLLYFCFTISIQSTILLLFDSIGFTLSALLLREHFRRYEKISFCQIGEKVDCNYVADRNPLQKWLPIDLAAIGIFFFLFNIFSLLIVGTSHFILGYITICAAFFTMLLSAYQIFKIKKYCLYCLSIAIVMIAKLCFSDFSFNINSINLLPKFIIAAIITSSLTYLIYKKMENDKALLDNDINILKIKRNPQIIKQYFAQPHCSLPNIEILEFGNKHADVVITTFISLHCRHCQKVVSEIILLIEKFPNRFLWRFTIQAINNKGMSDKEFALLNARQLHLLELYRNNKKRCLESMRLWDFKIADKSSDELIAKYRLQQQSIEDLKIKHYPIIWLSLIHI